MIYYCADDYGLCETASLHIQQCINAGKLNKVSLFPNISPLDLQKIVENKDIRVSLHLNLVEGKCMADPEDIDLIADKNGNFKHVFSGLFIQNILHRTEFETQVYKEIKAQVLFWKETLPEGKPFCIDSHQHTHMIPGIYKSLIRVLNDEAITVEHMRIPAEPLLPYIKTPSLIFTYNGVNLIKQWLLKFLWMINRKHSKQHKIPTSYFMGILFSGKMDKKRVKKILPHYIKMAQKEDKDIEVLFHPGYLDVPEADFESKNIVFEHFYLSKNRKTEFDSVMNI